MGQGSLQVFYCVSFHNKIKKLGHVLRIDGGPIMGARPLKAVGLRKFPQRESSGLSASSSFPARAPARRYDTKSFSGKSRPNADFSGIAHRNKAAGLIHATEMSPVTSVLNRYNCQTHVLAYYISSYKIYILILHLSKAKIYKGIAEVPGVLILNF